MTSRHLVCFVFLAICISAICRAETTPPPTLEIPAAARAGPNFDVKAATDAWLATVPADKKARSDSYFEGGYWLQLWDFLLFSAIMLFLLTDSSLGPYPRLGGTSPSRNIISRRFSTSCPSCSSRSCCNFP